MKNEQIIYGMVILYPYVIHVEKWGHPIVPILENGNRSQLQNSCWEISKHQQYFSADLCKKAFLSFSSFGLSNYSQSLSD